ncbi:hypothetical protein PHLCEN_2v3364, partial [Hermanssonia centrifuga]
DTQGSAQRYTFVLPYSTGNTSRQQSSIFVSPNSPQIPLKPPKYATTADIYVPWHAYRIRWAFDPYFYLAFIPRVEDYSCPLFSCLQHSKFSLPIETVPDAPFVTYQLPPSVQEQWMYLETVIDTAFSALCKLSNFPFPLEHRAPRRPSEYGYTKTYEVRKKAHDAAMFAKASFALRLALVSFLVCVMRRTGDAYEDPWWAQSIVEEKLLPLEVVYDLVHSWVCNFSVPRKGAFVDITLTGKFDDAQPSASTQWFSFIPKILDLGACVPLWFYYGEDVRQFYINDVARTYRPAEDEVKAALERQPDMQLSSRRYGDVRMRGAGVGQEVHEATTPPPRIDSQLQGGQASEQYSEGGMEEDLAAGATETRSPYQQRQQYKARPKDSHSWQSRRRYRDVGMRGTRVDQVVHEATTPPPKINSQLQGGQAPEQYLGGAMGENLAAGLTETRSPYQQRQEYEARPTEQPISYRKDPHGWQLVCNNGSPFQEIRVDNVRVIWNSNEPSQQRDIGYRNKYDNHGEKSSPGAEETFSAGYRDDDRSWHRNSRFETNKYPAPRRQTDFSDSSRYSSPQRTPSRCGRRSSRSASPLPRRKQDGSPRGRRRSPDPRRSPRVYHSRSRTPSARRRSPSRTPSTFRGRCLSSSPSRSISRSRSPRSATPDVERSRSPASSLVRSTVAGFEDDRPEMDVDFGIPPRSLSPCSVVLDFESACHAASSQETLAVAEFEDDGQGMDVDVDLVQPRPKEFNAVIAVDHQQAEHEQEQEQDKEDTVLAVDPFLTILQYRYGFVEPSPQCYVSHPSFTKIALPTDFIPHVMSFNLCNETIPEQTLLAVRDFISRLATTQIPPVELCDLIPGNTTGLPRLLGAPMTASVVQGPPTADCQWYSIHSTTIPDGCDVSWTLVVEDPTTVSEVLRRGWGPSKLDVARGLLQRGIPFRTLLPVDQHVPKPSVPQLNIQLGHHPYDYQPTPGDYTNYEGQRDTLLGRERVCRAALMKGGIVWRLAMEMFGVESVLFGPKDVEAALYRAVLHDGGSYVDDDLTQDELDVVCGVYKVTTKNNLNAHSASSWWPKSSTWLDSGFDFGYWTPQNELWFCRRRREIRAGQAKLKTTKEWKAQLKGEKVLSRQLISKIRELSSRGI